MNIFETIINKIFILETKPQKIGLSQLKSIYKEKEQVGPSLNKKDVKLSDLMRRASYN